MKDFLIVAFSFVVVLILACLKAKWLQDQGDDYMLVPKTKIQTLFGDDKKDQESNRGSD